MSLRLVALLLIGITAGYQVGLDSADSDAAFTQLLVYAAIFLVPLIGVGWLAWWRWQPPSEERWHQRVLRVFFVLLAIAGAHSFGWWRVHPAHLRYGFTYPTGASGTWHEVQFHHLENGTWIEGPGINAWPMRVRFPDLNDDGHADLEITGQGRVTFLYLPNNDGKKYWQLHEREGPYGVDYAPAGLRSI